jgi:hypothetical protein
MLRNLEVQDQVVGSEFRQVLATAPEGYYFRTLVKAIDKSVPFGQPIDFPGIVRELAKMEQKMDSIDRRLPYREFTPPTHPDLFKPLGDSDA